MFRSLDDYQSRKHLSIGLHYILNFSLAELQVVSKAINSTKLYYSQQEKLQVLNIKVKASIN